MINIDTNIRSVRPLRENLKETLKKISCHFSQNAKHCKPNPVIIASNSWKIASSQLEDILGKEIHRQWFSNIRPLVVSDKLLILQAPNRPASLWINKHYQNLVDLLLSFQDKDLNSFFICPADLSIEGSENHENS